MALRSLRDAPRVSNWNIIRSGKRLTQDMLLRQVREDALYSVAMGPAQSLVVTTPAAAKEVLTNPDTFIKLQDPSTRIFNRLWGGPVPKPYTACPVGVVIQNGADWARQRKALAPAFTTKALRQLVPLFEDEAKDLLDDWARQAERQGGQLEVDAKTAMSKFALDVLGRAVLGARFGANKGNFDETYNAYKYAMSQNFNVWFMMFPFLEKMLFLPRNVELNKAIDILLHRLKKAVSDREAEWKREEEEGRPRTGPADLLDLVVPRPGRENVHGIRPEELVPNLWIFFLAGHDTTATSLAWIVRLLSRYPDVQAKARQEAQAALGSDGVVRADLVQDNAALPYISSVMRESLRLFPPVYNLLSRVTSRDAQLAGYEVPKNTMISLGIAAINRHPEAYESPHVFLPERWLTDKPSTFEFLSFSAGPRNCLGDKFSLMEQRTMLLKLLTRFEILPIGGAVKSGTDGGLELFEDYEYAADSMPMFFCQPDSVQIKLRLL